MNDDYAESDAAAKAFDENALSSCNNDTLQTHLIALANEQVPNQSVQHRNIIRGITINHILLQRHIERLNKQNSITQWLVIALTVTAVLIGIPQLWFAYKADKRAETEQTPNKANPSESKSQTSIPIQSQPPSKSPVSSPAMAVSPIPKKP